MYRSLASIPRKIAVVARGWSCFTTSEEVLSELPTWLVKLHTLPHGAGQCRLSHANLSVAVYVSPRFRACDCTR